MFLLKIHSYSISIIKGYLLYHLIFLVLNMSINNEITVAQAQTLLDTFKNNELSNNQPRGINLNKSVFLDLINQSNVESLNLYFGINNCNDLCLVIIAMDNNGVEISTKIMDLGSRIPPAVPSISPFTL